MINPDTKVLVERLEYWLSLPFKYGDNSEPLFAASQLDLLLSSTLHGEEYNDTLLDIEEAYQSRKFKYKHGERRQVEKAIKAMKSPVLSRIISTNIIPAATKIANKVKPAATDAWNNTILPTTDKTLRFLTKVFVKPKIEVVEKDTETTTIEE